MDVRLNNEFNYSNTTFKSLIVLTYTILILLKFTGLIQLLKILI